MAVLGVWFDEGAWTKFAAAEKDDYIKNKFVDNTGYLYLLRRLEELVLEDDNIEFISQAEVPATTSPTTMVNNMCQELTESLFECNK